MASEIDSDKIITDVDRLMHVISRRKKLSILQLQSETGIARKEIDTWLKVLEDQGFVRIDYSIGAISITWTGEPAEEFESEGEESHRRIIEGLEKQEQIQPKEKQASSDYVEYHAPRGEENRMRFEREHGWPQEPGKNAQAKKAQESMAEKVVAGEEKEEEAAEAKIIIPESEGDSGDNPQELNFGREPMAEEELKFERIGREEEKEEEAEAKEEASGLRLEMRAKEQEQKREEDEDNPEESDLQAEPELELETEPEPVNLAEVPKPAKREKTIKAIVSGYLDEINKQKSMIESLKREKEYVHRKKYLSLESKIESDLGSISEKILEKESRILELRERALELPDKVDELAKLQENIANVEVEGRGVLLRTREKINTFLGGMKKSKDSIEEKVSRNKAVIEAGKRKLGELGTAVSSLEGGVARLNERAAEMRATVERVSGELHSLYDDIENVSSMKSQVSEIIASVNDSIETKEEELEGLTAGLEELEKIERWVEEYVRDYETKMESLEQYVHAGDEELSKLREASESEYIRKYLRELETLANGYERELEGISSEEQGIETRISEAKSRLEALVGESKSILKKFRSEQGTLSEEPFEMVAARAKEKLKKSRALIEEKSKERQKLRDEVRTSKGKRKKKQEEVRTKAKDKRKKGKKK